ncbi:MAG: membrane protein insertase YidC [Candidatus Obscuribacterales bacterium]|nr:membrane protein insertase YidC [Candidatus Obscuribacterales bacterium]
MDLTYSFMIPILETFEKWTHSYGWALVCLTVLVRILLWPLVAKQTESMQRMSKLSPMMKKLKEKYEHDSELYQRKTMEFMTKNRMNPMSSCLPLLIQLPIFIALFATFSGPPFGDKPVDAHVKVLKGSDVVREVIKETSDGNVPYVGREGLVAKVALFPGELKIPVGEAVDFGGRAVEGELSPDFKPTWEILKDNKKVTDKAVAEIDQKGHAVFHSDGEYKVVAIIHGVAKEEQFGFINGLGKVAVGPDLLKVENFDAVILIAFFGFTMWLSQKLNVVTPKPVDGEPVDEQQKVQQDVMKIMPIALTGTFVFIPLPVGVLVYMVISNVIQSGQTWLLMRKPAPPLIDVMDDGDDIIVEAKSTSGKDKSRVLLESGNGKDLDKGQSLNLKEAEKVAKEPKSSSTKRRNKKKKKK